jgi:hypothetical protein
MYLLLGLYNSVSLCHVVPMPAGYCEFSNVSVPLFFVSCCLYYVTIVTIFVIYPNMYEFNVLFIHSSLFLIICKGHCKQCKVSCQKLAAFNICTSLRHEKFNFVELITDMC